MLLTYTNVRASDDRITSAEFCEKALDIAENKRTLYVMGGYGTTLNSKGKNYSYRTFEYNRREDRWRYIANATPDTFGFDCVCFIKSILWGFSGDTTKDFGGAVYGSNGVRDFTCEEMINMCPDKSSNFQNIEAGEVLYMTGHVGIYVGNGVVVESSPRWGNGVQKTTLANIGHTGPNSRTWLYHGHLPYVNYGVKPEEKPEPEKPSKPEQEKEQYIKELEVVIMDIKADIEKLQKDFDRLLLIVSNLGGGEG